ncbi:MAG: hypothetical protein K0S41_605 [Anaerocolumna sp.]|jgi:V/A-type H+-transporting ATPase subunit C|nr:hypothetical protein [Anaerocolumna sp.]
MNNLLSYSGIITKAKAMEIRFITYNDYQTISNLESTSDYITFLKNHPGYSEIFNGIDEHIIHRGQAEGMLIYSLYHDFSKLYRFSNLTQRNVLDFIFFRYEVNVLKACMHAVYNKDEDYDLSLFSSFFNKHSKINVKALASSHSMEEYINHLKGTEYYSILTNIQKSDISSFDYEMKLDVHYFMKSWKLKDKLLKGDDLKALTHSFGTEIDLLNIMWLYRSKKFYHSSESYSYIIPVTYKLSKERLIKLMEAITFDEFAAALKGSTYEKIIPSLSDGTIELTYQKMIWKIYWENKNLYPTSMAPISYYLFHKRDEVRRLTTALECIRYKLAPQDTLKYVL